MGTGSTSSGVHIAGSYSLEARKEQWSYGNRRVTPTPDAEIVEFLGQVRGHCSVVAFAPPAQSATGSVGEDLQGSESSSVLDRFPTLERPGWQPLAHSFLDGGLLSRAELLPPALPEVDILAVPKCKPNEGLGAVCGL